MKAQISTEYLIIVSFALMVLVPFALYLQDVSRRFSEDNSLTVASNSVKKIGQAADWVYSQGEPSKLNIQIAVPNNVEDISFVNNSIIWKIKTSSGVSDIYYTSIANLTGSLPTSSGYYYVLVQALENGVSISVSPS
jgi:hypothetical protein